MNRRIFIIAGVILAVVLAVVLAFGAFGFWGSADWGTHSEITHVIPGQNGETLIIQEGGRDRFFPVFPFFLFFPLLWILVIGGFFAFFGRRRWGGGAPFGPGSQDRQAWLTDWHQSQHAAVAEANEPPAAPTEQPPPES